MGRILDKLLGPPLRRLGIALGFRDLVLDLLLDLCAQLFGVLLRILAFTPHELFGGALSFGHSRLDLTSVLPVDLFEPGATTFADGAGPVRESLGFARG